LIYEREQKDRHAEIQGFWKVLATKIDAGADVISWTRAEIDTAMKIRNPEKNFGELWKTFHNRYPFFVLRNVDWKKQYDTYRPGVTRETSPPPIFRKSPHLRMTP
jgi:hypothetical protein